ncbi:TonB-dependent receptor domain-containing protein [Chitinophaga japonensis]|uniref:Outer membrane receptor protein involved in Fe transport n=1 Tax=Chitinophaga japonensis TaxID=104662 RepID=A0A562TFQ1_CHIJA|nr:TonB-dependent receptor [Chitinophaga japonensis]TWI92369.1 outer membrane receptor protein involved in Fe transport [Chitinophaga japonensis]
MKYLATSFLLLISAAALAQQQDTIARKKALRAVEVTGKTRLRKAKEQAFTITAVDARQLHNTTSNINQVLNRTSGVRIREEGGLGSTYSFSLNGFTGKQVKFFLDGVPMDNFGSSLTLNNLPVNMAERIEVYKGVVPIHLGSDALGGAVNVITNQHIKKYLDVSYSYGSFNTHLASLNARHTTSSGLMINVSAFHNYSDNSYKVNVEIPDPETGIFGPEQKVRRFHDAYRSTMGQVELGVVNKKYADKLLFGLIAADNRKELQTGISMDQVAGMAFNTSQSFIPTFKYRKENLFTEGLTLVANANYSFVKAGITDTSSRKYDWYGNYTPKSSSSTSGEIYYNKTLFRFRDRNAFAMANLSYALGQHAFSLNHTYNRFRRQGEDPISKYPIPFSEPNIISKHVSGLAYTYTAADNRWSATVFGKLFSQSASTVNAEWGGYEPLQASYTKAGYGAAATFHVFPWAQLKASYENTWRMPEGEEMFGNGLLLVNNPALKPEHSHNINAGLLLIKTLGLHRLEGEVNYIYRKAGDFIRLESDGQISRYSNLDSVRTSGVEWTVKYVYNKAFSFELNGTYQNTLNVKEFDKGIRNYTYWDRLPNTPYLFGNLDLGYRFSNVLRSGNVLSLNAGATFVEEFYLYWPSQGSAGSKFIIPEQFTQHAGVTYSMQNGKYNVSFACTNLSDARVYDNFKLQKPGRAFNVKLRYFLH